jgi:hypothetical protein
LELYVTPYFGCCVQLFYLILRQRAVATNNCGITVYFSEKSIFFRVVHLLSFNYNIIPFCGLVINGKVSSLQGKSPVIIALGASGFMGGDLAVL